MLIRVWRDWLSGANLILKFCLAAFVLLTVAWASLVTVVFIILMAVRFLAMSLFGVWIPGVPVESVAAGMAVLALLIVIPAELGHLSRSSMKK